MLILFQDELREAVLLVFANKQDLPNAMNAAEITDKLGLHSLRQRHWYFFSPPFPPQLVLFLGCSPWRRIPNLFIFPGAGRIVSTDIKDFSFPRVNLSFLYYGFNTC